MLTPAPIFVVSTPQELELTIMNGIKVIGMVDADSDDYHVMDRYPNMLAGSILLPPYDAVSAEIEEMYFDAATIYSQYLASRDPDMFLSALLAASVQGIGLAIYIPREAQNMKFVANFLSYVLYTFGIQIQYGNILYMYNNGFDIPNLCKLYLYDLINIEQFLLMYPSDMSIDPIVLNKLVFETRNPYTKNNTPQEYLEFFNHFRTSVQKAGRMMIIPLLRSFEE